MAWAGQSIPQASGPIHWAGGGVLEVAWWPSPECARQAREGRIAARPSLGRCIRAWSCSPEADLAGARRVYDEGETLPSHPPRLVPPHGPLKGIRKSCQRKSRVIYDFNVSAQMHRLQSPLRNKSPPSRSSSRDHLILVVDSVSQEPWSGSHEGGFSVPCCPGPQLEGHVGMGSLTAGGWNLLRGQPAGHPGLLPRAPHVDPHMMASGYVVLIYGGCLSPD